MALIVFGVVLSIVASLTRKAIEQRRRIDARRTALLEVSNALEILEAHPERRPAVGEVRELEMPAAVAGAFESPKLIARATRLEGDSGGVRLDVELTWLTAYEQRSSPIGLSTIIFPGGPAGGGP